MELISEMRSFAADEIRCLATEKGFLGNGSYGTVQCVFHPSLGWVAAKCFLIRDGKISKDNFVQQIQNELSTLQKANHENILRVYGWTDWEGTIAIITDLMPAGSLRLILGNDNVPLHPVLRLRMCKEVSDGTAFIHNFSSTKRLTHGDLKPENILLTDELHCKVGDFGSARVIKKTGITTTTTDNSTLKQQMTPVYAAPERLRQLACKPKKEQDTYSYGLIVHGVLSRETPTKPEESNIDFLKAIKRGERPSTAAIDELEESLTTNEEKEIIQELKSVMIRCWQDVPADRPDMRDVRDQLQQLMSKWKPGSILRSAADALDAMNIFIPKKQDDDQCVVLSNFFVNSRDGKLHESRKTDSVTSATIGSTTDSPSTAETNQTSMKSNQSSTNLATISSHHGTSPAAQRTQTSEMATMSSTSDA